MADEVLEIHRVRAGDSPRSRLRAELDGIAARLHAEALCGYHSAVHGDDWAAGNRVMCDFLHRGIVRSGASSRVAGVGERPRSDVRQGGRGPEESRTSAEAPPIPEVFVRAAMLRFR